MRERATIYNQAQKEWAYKKWCEGYTTAEIGKALYMSKDTIRRMIDGRPKVKPPLKYNEEVLMREPLIFQNASEVIKEMERKLGITIEIIKMEITTGEHKGTIINVFRKHYDNAIGNQFPLISGYKDDYCYLLPLSELRRVEE